MLTVGWSRESAWELGCCGREGHKAQPTPKVSARRRRAHSATQCHSSLCRVHPPFCAFPLRIPTILQSAQRFPRRDVVAADWFGLPLPVAHAEAGAVQQLSFVHGRPRVMCAPRRRLVRACSRPPVPLPSAPLLPLCWRTVCLSASQPARSGHRPGEGDAGTKGTRMKHMTIGIPAPSDAENCGVALQRGPTWRLPDARLASSSSCNCPQPTPARLCGLLLMFHLGCLCC
jgi:hypothetical protein